ncbi:hypothetical protein JB92DRAFT_3276833 [Gautieria morchelliformis]|nr:hypothetical protein JB92DRAFT_3276833 [Gautieria morchelliformis]
MIQAQTLDIPLPALERLGRQRVMSPLLGFLSTTDIPMWRLGTLTGEEYLDEDILNAMLELDYILFHYTGFNFKATLELHHYDPLGGPPVGDVQQVISWVLEGLRIPQVTSIKSEAGPRQSLSSGSCGIATVSFLESQAGLDQPRWSWYIGSQM